VTRRKACSGLPRSLTRLPPAAPSLPSCQVTRRKADDEKIAGHMLSDTEMQRMAELDRIAAMGTEVSHLSPYLGPYLAPI